MQSNFLFCCFYSEILPILKGTFPYFQNCCDRSVSGTGEEFDPLIKKDSLRISVDPDQMSELVDRCRQVMERKFLFRKLDKSFRVLLHSYRFSLVFDRLFLPLIIKNVANKIFWKMEFFYKATLHSFKAFKVFSLY